MPYILYIMRYARVYALALSPDYERS